MKPNIRFRIDRRLLIAAAVIYILLFAMLILSSSSEWDWNRVKQDYGILIFPVLPAPLFFAALRFPEMIYSKILAGVCTFWMVITVLMTPLLALLVPIPYSAIESSLLFNLAYAAYSIFILICAVKSAIVAVAWVSELREKKKVKNAGEGIEQMTKGLITFLRPRLLYALVFFGVLLMINMVFIETSTTDVELFVIEIICFRVPFLLTVVYILWRIWDYHRYIKGLEHSGVLNQAVLEYYGGHEYCEGHVVLGVEHIFVEGEARIYKYDDYTKYFYKWDDSGRVHYWYLYAVKKDGTEMQLIELPYKRTQENYYEHVYPMVNEIRIKSKNVVIEGPGKFRK